MYLNAGQTHQEAFLQREQLRAETFDNVGKWLANTYFDSFKLYTNVLKGQLQAIMARIDARDGEEQQ